MICKNMSERCIINNYSVVEYYFLPVLIGVRCVYCDIFAYRKNNRSARLRKNDFLMARVASGYYIRDKNNGALRRCNKNADGLFVIDKKLVMPSKNVCNFAA